MSLVVKGINLLKFKQNRYEKEGPDYWACLLLSTGVTAKLINPKIKFKRVERLALELNSSEHYKQNGLSVSESMAIFSRLGINSTRKKVPVKKCISCSVQLINDGLDMGGPVLVFPKDHAVVILEVINGTVYFFEPDDLKTEVTELPVEDFLEYWSEDQEYLEFLIFP